MDHYVQRVHLFRNSGSGKGQTQAPKRPSSYDGDAKLQKKMQYTTSEDPTVQSKHGTFVVSWFHVS